MEVIMENQTESGMTDAMIEEQIRMEEAEYALLLDRQQRISLFPGEEISDEQWEKMWRPVEEFLPLGEVDED